MAISHAAEYVFQTVTFIFTFIFGEKELSCYKNLQLSHHETHHRVGRLRKLQYESNIFNNIVKVINWKSRAGKQTALHCAFSVKWRMKRRHHWERWSLQKDLTLWLSFAHLSVHKRQRRSHTQTVSQLSGLDGLEPLKMGENDHIEMWSGPSESFSCQITVGSRVKTLDKPTLWDWLRRCARTENTWATDREGGVRH